LRFMGPIIGTNRAGITHQRDTRLSERTPDGS